MFSRRALRSLTPAMLVTAVRSLSATPSTTIGGSSSITIPPETLAAIKTLEPRPLWSHFAAVSSIPRPSKQETAVLDYIRSVAKSNGLSYKEDKVGNLCVFRPGSGGGEDSPPVIIQGHVDMVTEKNAGTDHDFETDPIRLRHIEDANGNWIGAYGTTLGADNGIGVAAALALLSIPLEGPDACDRPLPPIEALFTVDEETGLTGAMDLDAEALGLTGRTMLNLDTEEWGDLYVGCAGGGETEITFPLNRLSSQKQSKLLEIRVDGLLGGHSGINIHEGRANAVVLCAMAAKAALEEINAAGQEPKAHLISIRGGDKHNAIPREASAILSIDDDKSQALIERVISKRAKDVTEEFGTLETKLRMSLSEVEKEDCLLPLDQSTTDRLLSMLLAIPIGPFKFSHVIPDLVETSNNLASIVCTESEAKILCSSRSSVASALESTRDKISAVAFLAGASVRKYGLYPGWNPNPSSKILSLAQQILRERLDREPGVKAIHAGLECGLLLEKLGRDEATGAVVDALSFGPTITGAHSPDERIDADTVPPFFDLVLDILAELAVNKK